jgi:hypothetical protein
MKKFLLIPALALGLAVGAHAATVASDVASNPAYSGGWGNGTNGGSGFSVWTITNNDGDGNFAGSFIGDSTVGAGNINTGGSSFGLYANPGGAPYVNANRLLSTSLTSLDTFTFQLALNYNNGQKGFNLWANSTEVFYFTVSNATTVGSSATLVAGPGAGYNYGGNDAVLNVTIGMTSATSFSYAINRTSSQGFQGDLFTGNVSGLTGGIDAFNFYVNGTDDGIPQNNLYINNLQVNSIPEPSALALLGLGTLALAARSIKNRRKIGQKTS